MLKRTQALRATTHRGTALAYLTGQITEIRQQIKADDAEIAEIKAVTAAFKDGRGCPENGKRGSENGDAHSYRGPAERCLTPGKPGPAE